MSEPIWLADECPNIEIWTWGRVRPALLRRKHYDRATPGLNRANQIMSVANDVLAAVR